METPDGHVAIEALRRLTTYIERASGLRLDIFPEPAPVPGRARGPLQQSIADLPGLMDSVGLSSVEVAAQVECSVPNIYRLLRALCDSGVIEPVPGTGPHRWRLSEAHRRSPAVFERYASSVRPGEWTSCADLSIAGRGDLFAARLVCWAAEHVDGFPNAQRVLLTGGVPHPSDHEHQRRRPAEIRGLLIGEGLAFTSAGSAAPSRRVTWDQLRDRVRGTSAAHGPNGRMTQPVVPLQRHNG
jgi:hypothetical protein